MNDDRKPLKYLLAFELPSWKWDGNFRADQAARIKSGYTSVRVTKDTLRQLQALRARVLEIHGKESSSSWYGSLSLDDVLNRLASGNLGMAGNPLPTKKQRRKVRA